MRMAAFRAGDFCSKGGDRDQGDLSLWLRRNFPIWSPDSGCNGGIGSVGGRVHCEAIISTPVLTVILSVL